MTAQTAPQSPEPIRDPRAYAAVCAWHARIIAWRAQESAKRKAQRAADEAALHAAVLGAQALDKALSVRLAFEARELHARLVDSERETGRKRGAANVAAAIAAQFEGASASDIVAAQGISIDNAYQRVKRGCDWMMRNGSQELCDWLRNRKGAWVR